MKSISKRWRLLFLLATWAVTVNARTLDTEERWKRVLNLEGQWKFTIGDNKKWADPKFNDGDWELIDVPSKWEDEGFYGYNGYAWYRTSFNGADLKSKGSTFNVFLGYIDDVDEVYVNGHRIGSSGSFPPKYHTAYNAMRKYFLPSEFINFNGRNVIAVRVYDAEIEGGIVSGDVGIYVDEDDTGLAVNLRGPWDFTIVDKKFGNFRSDYPPGERRAPSEKSVWTKLNVPATWESQGYDDYDGSAWYRKQFMIPKELQGEDLVLLLGKIDDFDQTYFNGKVIGQTNAHDKLRTYYIPSEMVNAGAVNLLLVFVDDPQGLGGIYEGPVGLMKQSDFTRYLRWRK